MHGVPDDAMDVCPTSCGNTNARIASRFGRIVPSLFRTRSGVCTTTSRILISPFGIAALLTLQILEMVIQLVVVAFRPITDYLVLPVHRHFSRKEQERKKWWADRWLEVKGVFGKGNDKPPNAGQRK